MNRILNRVPPGKQIGLLRFCYTKFFRKQFTKTIRIHLNHSVFEESSFERYRTLDIFLAQVVLRRIHVIAVFK
jgi:hypothetical protein